MYTIISFTLLAVLIGTTLLHRKLVPFVTNKVPLPQPVQKFSELSESTVFMGTAMLLIAGYSISLLLFIPPAG